MRELYTDLPISSTTRIEGDEKIMREINVVSEMRRGGGNGGNALVTKAQE